MINDEKVLSGCWHLVYPPLINSYSRTLSFYSFICPLLSELEFSIYIKKKALIKYITSIIFFHPIGTIVLKLLHTVPKCTKIAISISSTVIFFSCLFLLLLLRRQCQF